MKVSVTKNPLGCSSSLVNCYSHRYDTTGGFSRPNLSLPLPLTPPTPFRDEPKSEGSARRSVGGTSPVSCAAIRSRALSK